MRGILTGFALISVLWSSTLPAAKPSFPGEWRTEVNRRLAVLLPSGKGQASASGVSIVELARILGTSETFAASALNRAEYNLNFGHLVKLAAHFDVNKDDLLAMDLFARFETLGELEAVLVNQRRGLREVLTRIFALSKQAETSPRPVVPARSVRGPSDFERRRRMTVNLRLAEFMPSQNGSSVSALSLSQVLGRAKSSASMIINGPLYLTEENAKVVAERFDVSPEWLLAADMLDEFENVEDLKRAVSDERRVVSELLLKLYDARPRGCVPQLAPKKDRCTRKTSSTPTGA